MRRYLLSVCLLVVSLPGVLLAAPAPTSDTRQQAAHRAAAREDATTRKGVVLIRLTQGRDGHILRVDLVAPSDNPALDAEVLRDLKTGQMVLPVPPVFPGGSESIRLSPLQTQFEAPGGGAAAPDGCGRASSDEVVRQPTRAAEG